MVTDSRQNCLQELAQIVLCDQALFHVLQQSQISPVAAEENKALPERRDQRYDMLQEQHRRHHRRRDCGRIDRPKTLTTAPDNRHDSQG